MLYGAAIWVLAGLFQHGWWVQFACFILSTLLVMRINSLNLLIRIYSRSVSVAFIFLSCAAVCLFPSWRGGIEQLCCIAAFMLLTECYQDNTTVGKSYYIFLLLGIATMLDAHVIFYLPLIWLMMRVIVYSLSWRTFLSSLLGLITPYWFMSGWLMWEKGGDYHAIARLFPFTKPFSSPSVLNRSHCPTSLSSRSRHSCCLSAASISFTAAIATRSVYARFTMVSSRLGSSR